MRTRLASIAFGSNRGVAGKPGASALLAAVVIALAMPAVGAESGTPARDTAPAQEPAAGQFTGRYVGDTPVYRLPSICVTVSRTSELARLEREERLARAGATRVKPAGRPPAKAWRAGSATSFTAPGVALALHRVAVAKSPRPFVRPRGPQGLPQQGLPAAYAWRCEQAHQPGRETRGISAGVRWPPNDLIL